MMKKRKHWGIVLLILMCIAVVAASCLFGINARVKQVGGSRIVTPEEAAELDDVNCILVLGCGVREDGTPSHMLEDRLRRGVDLYKQGAAPKLLMSGDHGRVDYNEVGTMKQYAVEEGIPSGDVFMDHAGFSTYESLYRAKEVFATEKIIIVTQEYHLYRALYIAERLGLEAYGVDADYRTYWGQTSREIREILARAKDFVNTLFWPEPTFLGEVIPVSGNGDMTNDTGKE
jgi:vancomycin permeability regulator SanA